MNNKETTNEINLIDLLVVLIKRKSLLLIFSALGLLLGSVYTQT